jgi:lysophospholipase-3
VEKLIEEMYHSNGDSKVILVCHSMGCLYAYYLLRHHPQSWKDQYIQSWITIASPFGGAVKSLNALTTGENFHTELFHESGLLELEKTWSSVGFLLPSAHVFGEQTILSVGSTNYTSNDYQQFYELINDPAGYRMWQRSSVLITDYEDPGVEMHCLRGKNMPTPEQITYPTPESFPKSPVTIYGQGDGTVNQISSDVCLKWSGRSNFYTKEFGGIRHLDMVKNMDVVSHVTSVVLHANMNSP